MLRGSRRWARSRSDAVPPSRRSLGYGFSNMLTFGVGSFGAGFAGFALEWSNLFAYGSLAVLAVGSGLVALVLWRMKLEIDRRKISAMRTARMGR